MGPQRPDLPRLQRHARGHGVAAALLDDVGLDGGDHRPAEIDAGHGPP